MTKYEMRKIVVDMVNKYREDFLAKGWNMYKITRVDISTRCTKRFGVCKYQKFFNVKTMKYDYTCEIVISDFCFHLTKNCVRDTILHELIHTIKGCENHRAPFQNKARQVMAMYEDCHIGTHCSKEESTVRKEYMNETGKERRRQKRYTVICEGCGQKYHLTGRHGLVKALKNGTRHFYSHPKCGCHDFKLIEE